MSTAYVLPSGVTRLRALPAMMVVCVINVRCSKHKAKAPAVCPRVASLSWVSFSPLSSTSGVTPGLFVDGLAFDET